MTLQPGQISTYSLLKSIHGGEICNILTTAINGIDAGAAIKRHITRDAASLVIEGIMYDLSTFKRVFVIGAGKACIPMANTIQELLHDQITRGLIITKDKYSNTDRRGNVANIKIIEAGHPLPDKRNLYATFKLLSIISNLNSDDLVIILLSGGGSALLMNPAQGITLPEIQATTEMLLFCGAPINEINTIRKHIDLFKGGGLLKFLAPATVISLILSDVVGDNLEVIASGPTVADPTTYNDAWAILNKYQLLDNIPPKIKSHIYAGVHGDIPETIKPGDPLLSRTTNILIGKNLDVVNIALTKARMYGFNVQILPTPIQGEASQIGNSLSENAKALLAFSSSNTKPACLIAGGETTVTKKGTGKGGRNQELALASVINLSGSDQWVLISLATDGEDGSTDAAGAVTTNETYGRGLVMGLDPTDYLSRNDSYHYFKALNDLIKTGPTMTNVNDLIMIFHL
jgi:glycerate 2-kinase